MQPSRPNRHSLDSASVLENARWMALLARHLASKDAGSDDLVQETWLAFLRKPPRHREAVRSWLRRVLRNFALRSRRAESRRCAREETIARTKGEPSDPAEVVERAELLQRISQLALGLEEPYRSTVLLRYFDDLSPAEIARRQGTPINTVYTRLRRALEDLRARLDDEHGGNRAVWLAVLAPLAALPLAASGAAAASASASHSSLGQLALGGIPLASKKLGLSIAISTCLFLVVGSLIIWSHSSSRREGAGGEAAKAIALREAKEREEKSALTGTTRPPLPAPAPAIPGAETAAVSAPALRGRVLDSRGAGIGSADVIAVPLRAWEEETAADLRGVDRVGDGDVSDELSAILRRLRASAARLPRTRSIAGGEFRFDVLGDGEHRLLAWREGYLPATTTIVLVTNPRTTSVDLELTGAEAIRGRVVDEQKNPVAGATVRSRPVSWRRVDDAGRRAKLIELFGEARFLAESRETASAEDGSFVLASLEPGLHDLLAMKPGSAPTALFDIPAGSASVEVVLSRGLTVTGVVVGPEKKPVPGAEVMLEAQLERTRPAIAVGESNEATVSADVLFECERTVRASTDEKGRFELTGIAAGRHFLSVKAPAFPALSREIDVREATDLGTLVLSMGGAIAGVVLDPTGAPVGDARVWIEDVPAEGVSEWGGRFYTPRALVETRTRADGLFRLEGLNDGAYSLHAAAAAWTERTLGGVRPGRDDVRIELSDGFARKGRVVDGATGTALPGARVALKQGLSGLPAAEKVVESGADGAFELRGLSRGNEKLVIETTHASYPGEKAAVELKGDARDDEIVLRLFPPETLSGRVVDTAGQPVAGARVVCAVAGAPACRSADDGSFVLSLPCSARSSDGFEVRASHASAGVGRVSVERPGEGLPWSDATIAIRAGSVLTGKVTGAGGAPVSKATVSVRRLGGNDASATGARETVYSRADGAFAFPPLEAGSYKLEAHALGFARAVIASVEVSESSPPRDIVLDPGRKTSGRVVDQDGRAVVRAEVVALETLPLDASDDFGSSPMRWRRRHVDAGVASAKTDSTGSYELHDLPSSRLTLVARAAAHRPSGLVIVGPDERPEDLVVTQLGSLSGSVEDATTRQPLSPFSVQISRKDEGSESNDSLIPRDYDDPSGSFRFDSLAPGHYAVAVLVSNRPPSGQWIDIRPGEETSARFTVESGSSVTGVVKDTDGGAPIAGATVRAFGNVGWNMHLTLAAASGWSGADGSFRIDGLEAGQYQVHAFFPGYVRKQKVVKIEAGADPPPVELELRRAGKLEGRLVNLSKRRAFFASLLLHRLDETGKEDQTFPLHSPEEFFSFDGVRPGHYEAQLYEEVPGPGVAPGALAFKREDMVERRVPLGELDVRAGETTRFEATVPELEPRAK